MIQIDTFLKGANMVAKDDFTIRQAAQKIGVGKSTLHNFLVSEWFRNEDFVLFDEVQTKLAEHLAIRHIRGGEATKQKALKRKAEAAA